MQGAMEFTVSLGDGSLHTSQVDDDVEHPAKSNRLLAMALMETKDLMVIGVGFCLWNDGADRIRLRRNVAKVQTFQFSGFSGDFPVTSSCHVR